MLSALGTEVFGSPLDKILIIAVLTSAAASTQTTILPDRSHHALDGARQRRCRRASARSIPRFLTPHVSTLLMGVASIVWYVGLTLVSEDILFDSLAALGLMISFYIGLTGFACAIYYRREIFRSVKNFFFVGVGPFLGGVILFYLLIKNAIELSDPANSESGNSWFGIGPPLVIAVFFLVLGVLLMFVQWRSYAGVLQAQAGGRAGRVPRGRSRVLEPVPIARGDGRETEMGQIVVGYDGSDCSRAALDEGLRTAKALGDEIVVVFGYSPPGLWGGEIAEHEEAIEERGMKVLEEAKHQAEAAGATIELELVAKKGSEAIVDVAEKRDARMIVVGSYGDAPLKGMILGSTPNKLLHMADRPVLVVPAQRWWGASGVGSPKRSAGASLECFGDPPQTPSLPADVETDQVRDASQQGADRVGPAVRKLRRLLAHDSGSDCLAADPLEGLGGNSWRRGIDEGQAGRLIAAV